MWWSCGCTVVALLKAAHGCSSCVSVVRTDLVCGKWQTECLLFLPHPTGFGSKLILLSQSWGSFSSDTHMKQPWAFWGARCASGLSQGLHKEQHFALWCQVGNLFTRVVPVFSLCWRILILVSFYGTFEMQDLFFILKTLKSIFSIWFSKWSRKSLIIFKSC